MNSNLNRALAAALVAFGGVVSAVAAQVDYDYLCVDANNTKPYSDDYVYQQKVNDLFGASIGLSGTKAYVSTPDCAGGGPIAGRIGFSLGSRGSYQDNDPNQAGSYVYPGTNTPINDEYTQLTRGNNMRFTTGTDYSFPGKYAGRYSGPPAGGASFARIYVRQGTATTNYLFGGSGFSLFYSGASGRFVVAEARVDGTDVDNSVDVRLNLEVIGDAARLNWRLTNNLDTTDSVALGLYFASTVELLTGLDGGNGLIQAADLVNPFTDTLTAYTTIPGRRPLTVEERFNRTGNSPQGESGGATVGVPPFVNFSASQGAGFGLQVVNNASALTGFDSTSGTDQTPVDEFVFGTPNTVFDGGYNVADPQINDFIFNAAGNGNADAASVGLTPGFIQKWEPATVTPNGFRDIVAYYRSITGDSSYSPAFQGYSVVVDTPKVISTSPENITTSQPFRSSRYTIRVNIDNTGGFSNTGTEVTLQSVDVTLSLPAGIKNPDTGQTTITKTISSVAPRAVQFIDFPITVDPNIYGPQIYSVTVSPNPRIGVKTVTGTINVAATPRLLLRPSANLVSPPFTFADSSWESVLGLRLNQDFQAFTWDALAQQYVPQVSAERGRGTFIVLDGDQSNDQGFRVLGGTPSQPNDEFPSPANNDVALNGGASIIRLQPGWNLVGNPYNYAFPINLIIAAGSGASQSVTFQDLISQGATDGTFQYYDQDGRQYRTISNTSSSNPLLLPNVGYWIYANTQFDIQFPPIYELFARASKPVPEFAQTERSWKLQLSAAAPAAKDTQSFVGATNDPQVRSVRKAPMQPSARRADVLYAFVSGDGGAPMAQSLRQGSGTQSFTYNVFSKNGGPVTVSWPNLKSLPSGFKVSITDNAAKKTIDARKSSGYSFTSKEAVVRTFTVTVGTNAAVPQKVTSASYSLVRSGRSYVGRFLIGAAAKGGATLRLTRGGVDLGVIANVGVRAGSNTVTWPLTDGDGRPVPNGNYTVVVEVTGEGGDVVTRNMAIVVRR